MGQHKSVGRDRLLNFNLVLVENNRHSEDRHRRQRMAISGDHVQGKLFETRQATIV